MAKSTYEARLPPELILHITKLLCEPVDSRPSSLSNTQLPSAPSTKLGDNALYTTPRRTIAALSSTCLTYRSLLMAHVWDVVEFRRPSTIVVLRELLAWYAQATRITSPAPHVREVRVNIPDHYHSFNTSSLTEVLQEMVGLQSIKWDAEVFPSAAILRTLSGKGNFEGNSQRRCGPSSLSSLSLDCKTFWGGSTALAELTTLRHLKLTSYDAHLLPTHLPALLDSLIEPLQSLSMSTSKTSILHELDSKHFARLEQLDIYPVTPETPLDEALAAAGPTLRHLRISLDVSGAFGNYDKLWSSLTGRMPALESLIVDPHPQQNTAPSFTDFVASCGQLKLINGRQVSGFPPCLGLFTPDTPSGALAY